MSSQLYARKRVKPKDAPILQDKDEYYGKDRKLVGRPSVFVRLLTLFAASIVAYPLLQIGKKGIFSTSSPLGVDLPMRSIQTYVTVVLPSVVNTAGRPGRLDAIASTWGPASHAIFVIHNVTDFSASPMSPKSEIVLQRYPQNLLVPPEITPNDGLLRLNFVIRTIFEQVDPDFAFFVNDHTYVIPEHMCSYLSEKSPDQHLYAGHALHNQNNAFNTGAAGYFLSRKTMQGLVQKWNENNAACLLTNVTSRWLHENPGLVTAACLDTEMGVKAIDTRENGAHRFHVFGLIATYTGTVDQWYINKHYHLKDVEGFNGSYAAVQAGEACCAKETITFHYVEALEAKALFHIRQQVLNQPHISNAELKATMINKWPSEQSALGPYSRPLPDQGDTDSWRVLLIVLRWIST